jgi:hypothetical protein
MTSESRVGKRWDTVGAVSEPKVIVPETPEKLMTQRSDAQSTVEYTNETQASLRRLSQQRSAEAFRQCSNSLLSMGFPTTGQSSDFHESFREWCALDSHDLKNSRVIRLFRATSLLAAAMETEASSREGQLQ